MRPIQFTARGIVRYQTGGRYRLMCPDMNRDELARAGQSYRDRQERDLRKHQEMVGYAEGSGCRWQRLLGYFGGHWLDERAGTTPWLSILGFFFGCAAAGKAIHRTWKEMAVVTAREEREKGNPAPLYDSARDRQEKADETSQKARPSPISSPETHDEG